MLCCILRLQAAETFDFQVDVDFDFFDLAAIDYHSIGLLLRQLLSHDAPDFDISALTNAILEQNLGSTVKCDGQESDPLAFCTALNLAALRTVRVSDDLMHCSLTRWKAASC